MNQNEFIYWLEGFLCNKVSMGASEVELIRNNIDKLNITKTHTIGYYPDPYVYPGLVGVDVVKKTEDESLNKTQTILLCEFQNEAKEMDVISYSKEGINVGDHFGETYFMNWVEVKQFLDTRRKLDAQDNN